MAKPSRNRVIAAALLAAAAVTAPPASGFFDEDDDYYEEEEHKPLKSYNQATHQEMTVPDTDGSVILWRDAHQAVGCTKDNHTVLTYIFVYADIKDAAAHRRNPDVVRQYTKTIETAFINAAQNMSSSTFKSAFHPDPDLYHMPQALRKALEQAHYAFAKGRQTTLNSALRTVYPSDTASARCPNR